MKTINSAILVAVAMLMSATALMGQSAYSALVIEQEVATKGIKSSMTYKVVHYLGSDNKNLMLESDSAFSLTSIVDILNKLDEEGWEVIDVSSFENLGQGDMKVAFKGATSTNYHQYLLRRKE